MWSPENVRGADAPLPAFVQLLSCLSLFFFMTRLLRANQDNYKAEKSLGPRRSGLDNPTGWSGTDRGYHRGSAEKREKQLKLVILLCAVAKHGL